MKEKNKLIVLEGADGSGKTTIAQLLQDSMKAELLVQPNGSNSLSFLRRLLKSGTTEFDSFARQLLHTCSHLVDFYELIKPLDNSLIMDRSYISALVYGAAQGESATNLKILKDIHKSVYGDLSKKYDVYIIILDRGARKHVKDSSYYESKIDLDYVESSYRNINRSNDYYFGSDEKIYHVKTCGDTKASYDQLMQLVFY
ncbi:Thymidylate kinase [Vibrio nigripulchritudo ATCC 27043]|uniref:dTMP kinase n=1 Tax=Vibrio nigripulchritudo TaxID=28173 RepID=UPI00021C1EF1|nr:deoxynucleoside kinase [Vibrio nigripulchritudo]EGU61057.1 Thymidylate kinase [Vibrio nigripulchritudo ATCC 27043]